MSAVTGLFVALVALAASAVFATLHMALGSLVRTTFQDMVSALGNPALEQRVERIVGDIDGHRAAMGLPRLVSTVLVVVGMFFWISHREPVGDSGVSLVSPTTLDVVLTVGLAWIGLWLVAFVIPSSVSEHAGEAVLVRMSWLVRLVYVVATPLLGISRIVDEVVRRLARVDADSEAEALEAELLSVVEEGRAEGQFDETEQEMIEAVVEFRSRSVEQIMTPRTEIKALAYTDDLEEVKAYVRDGGHSRIPVYRESLDHLVGVLYAKDLLRWMSAEEVEPEFSLERIVRPVVFVPETKTVRELMAELLAQKVHIALVIDEYGGTAGLVTFEDIVEEIFGEIQDEYEDPEQQVPEVVVDGETGTATIDARINVDDANDALEELRLVIPDHEDYDTVGGFVTVQLGRIPRAGESFVAEGLSVEVLEAEPTRVVRIRVGAARDPHAGGGPGDNPDRAMVK